MDKIMENNFFFSFNVHQCNFADNVAFIYFFFLGGGFFLAGQGSVCLVCAKGNKQMSTQY